MRYESTTFPYPISFPVFTEPNENNWDKLYYNKCNHDMYDTGIEPTCEKIYIEMTDPNLIIVDGWTNHENEGKFVHAINGSVPGPTLCVGWGDEIRVKLKNHVTPQGYTATSIHWHGMFQRDTPWHDGVCFASQCPILGGLEYDYVFKADPAGTHWYHSHYGVQSVDGIIGALIIQRDQEIREKLYDKVYNVENPEHVILIKDWEHETYQATLKKHIGHWVDSETGFPIPNAKSQDGSFTSGHPYVSGFINGRGSYNNNLEPWIFRVKANDSYRFRMISASAMYAYRVSIDNHKLQLLSIDGLDVEQVQLDGIIIFSAERYDFVVHTNRPGRYWIRAESLDGDGEILAILEVYDEVEIDEYYKPQTESIFISNDNRKKTVLNCPWADKYINDNTDCIQVGDLTRDRDQNDIRNSEQNYPNVKEAIENGNIIMLNFNIMGDSTDRQVPNIEGIYGKFTSHPPSVRTRMTIEDECHNEKHGSFEKCSHIIPLVFNQSYIFVFTNRWVNNDNPANGLNFPGIQPHPVHMHGHSFYVIGHNAGTFNKKNLRAGTYGCENGLGQCSHDQYCYDTETMSGDLYCPGNYWGNCTFKNLPDFKDIKEAPQKDVIVVPTHGWVAIALRTDNPGFWPLHCHIYAHLNQGMVAMLSEAREELAQLVDEKMPINIPFCNNYKESF